MSQFECIFVCGEIELTFCAFYHLPSSCPSPQHCGKIVGPASRWVPMVPILGKLFDL